MIPDAPNIASPIATFIIQSLPFLTFAPPVEIITPATIMRINDTIRITLTNILTRAEIRMGKAVVSLILESGFCVVFSTQSPMNGTLVLSFVPQHTSGREHNPQRFFCCCVS